jgi:hypothetical protein
MHGDNGYGLWALVVINTAAVRDPQYVGFAPFVPRLGDHHRTPPALPTSPPAA